MAKLKPRNPNFLRLFENERKSVATKKTGRVLAFIMPLLLLIAAFATAFALLFAGNLTRRLRLSALEAELEQVRPDYEETIMLAERRNALNDQLFALEEGLAANDLAPVIDTALFDAVAKCAGDVFSVSLYSYSESDYTLTLDASAPSVNDVPDFVEQLRATGLFSSVQYTGYTSDADGVYYCIVGCTLLEGVTAE